MSTQNSKKESITVQITHCYTCLSTNYYVKTDYSLLELNKICAYLQLLRWEFPYFLTIDDCIGQDDVVEILGDFYGCQKIVRKKSISCEYEIDLYDNWHHFVVGKNRQVLNKEYAKPGIRLAIIERMLIQAKDYGVCDDSRKDIQQLEYMKTGNSVPQEWGLKNGDGNLYLGKINVNGEKDLLLI